MEYEKVEINSDRWFDLNPLLNEVFKEIPHYEGKYQISNYGRVKSLERRVKHWNRFKLCDRYVPTRILKMSYDKDKYLICGLHCKENNQKKWVRVHILVANSFVANPLNKPMINHIDGNKQNPLFLNLEWVTDLENKNHAKVNGLVRKGRKLILYNEKETITFDDVKDFAKRNNISYGMAKYYIYNKKEWRNFKFKFLK